MFLDTYSFVMCYETIIKPFSVPIKKYFISLVKLNLPVIRYFPSGLNELSHKRLPSEVSKV